MEWAVILAPLFKRLIENCQDNSNLERAEAMKRHPNVARSRLRRSLRQDGMKGKKLKRAVKEGMAEFDAAEVSDIEELFNELSD